MPRNRRGSVRRVPDANARVAAIAARPAVAEAVAAALADLDALLWRRDIRREAQAAARSSVERGARDSAAIEGADVVEPDASPMGRVLEAAIAVTAEAPGLVPTWGTAPLQALARLHAVAARRFADVDALGRPRSGDVADDPLSIGAIPPAGQLAARLGPLPALAGADAPAVLVAALVHAELMALRPFTWGSGLVARATVRLVLAERAVDPSLFSVPERGMLELGRPAYVRAVRDYASGTPEGIDACVVWLARCVSIGARAAAPVT